MEAKDQAQTLCRFFLHYPEGHRAYIVIVDGQRRPFDFSDNRFKGAKKLASPRDACLYAAGKYDDRADHHYSYGIEFDLARLTSGETGIVPEEGAVVKVHWLMQVGDEPNVTVDKWMSRTCELHYVNGRFEPKNKWDRELLDETLAFEKRAKFSEEYRAFVLEEIEKREALWKRFSAAVVARDVAAQVRILAEDLYYWAKNLKQHLIHHVSHSATDPMYVRMADVPADAQFELLDSWIMRDWMGRIEVHDTIEFHKGAEYAESFAARFEPLHEARLKFSRLVVQYTVQHHGKDALGMISLDEIRKGLKSQAVAIVDYLDRMAGHFEITNLSRQGLTTAPSRPSAIETPHTPEATAGCDGLLVVDETTFRITWRGCKTIKIGNRKEFHLLAQLWLAKNKFVAHADLAECIGGDNHDTITHVKSRLVSLLKKNGIQELADLIQTETGHYGLFTE